MQLQEDWKKAKNYNKYSCSNLGKIRNDHTKRILGPKINNTEYITLALTNDDGVKIHTGIHRIIADTWIGNPDNKLTVNHKNKIKTDNRVDNLEWATHSEQNIHKNIGHVIHLNHNIGIWKCDMHTGEKIKYYRTTKDAMIDNNIKNGDGNISICARGKINYVYGFKWIYDDQKIIDINENSLNGEKWEQVCDKTHMSNFGKLVKKNRIIIPSTKNGYHMYSINGKQIRAHRLVAEKFIPNPNNYTIVNHIDGNKLNNIYTNLEWCTSQQNSQHAVTNGFNKNIKKVINYDTNNNIIKVYESCPDAGRQLNIDQSCINRACKGKANIYDKNKSKLNFKFIDPLDDLVNMKINTTNLLIKPKKIKSESKIRKINVYDKKNNLLDTCNSRIETSKKYNVNRTTITSHCDGIVKYSTCPYIFKYAD